MEFTPVKVTERVYWVGAVDWNIRDFHGYSTERGSTYNAYLILGDKIALIDTVKAPFCEELLARIAAVINPEKIDYIISDHAEMDHSGALPKVIAAVKPEKVFASVMGVKALKEHFHLDYEIVPLRDGDTLSLGNLSLKFLETRMLHWPDSMVTYLVEERLLFSQDGFGMHLATGERFADELDPVLLRNQAAKYYANILLPYSQLIMKLIERIKTLGMAIDIIAPDHGPIWRSDVGKILSWYQEWAEQRPGQKAVVVYDTMWQSTDLMARAIADGLAGDGIEVKVMRLRATDRSDVMTEVLDAGAIIIGSPTLNNGIFPTVADMLVYLKGLKPKNKFGAAFGSYGWSGEAPTIIFNELKGIGMEMVGEPLKVKYVPDVDGLKSCRALGKEIARRLKERVG
ncbi:MAG: flavodoxin domain-containing protein [candidate division WOR-3 bacterium]